jgi:hypothetical protein
MSSLIDLVARFFGDMLILFGHDIGRRRAQEQESVPDQPDNYDLVAVYPDELRDEERERLTQAQLSDTTPRGDTG